ncbi:phage head-tail connector protein [Robertmurraya massiliosenegalensis]|uniref:phage head-tail connector protein n=1 Tax=Robertmurraya TaxID=2837507 RepID=UPI0039A40141
MDVLEIVKAKLPSEGTPSDQLLEMYIDEVRQSILTYCNRNDVPADLNFVYANMVVDLITEESRKADSDAQQSVESIKEGDTQVTFGSISKSASETSTQQILFNYKSQLNRFRKLRR